jgi:hypothetical protein
MRLHRIANGKLVEKWPNNDILRFLQQLGGLDHDRNILDLS